jgi:hypothetical protein
MSRIVETLQVDEEMIWETKVPKGLRQVLIEDVIVTKVHFKLTSTKNSVNIEKFELVPKKKDVKTIVNKERKHEKKIVSKWFEGLAY